MATDDPLTHAPRQELQQFKRKLPDFDPHHHVGDWPLGYPVKSPLDMGRAMYECPGVPKYDGGPAVKSTYRSDRAAAGCRHAWRWTGRRRGPGA